MLDWCMKVGADRIYPDYYQTINSPPLKMMTVLHIVNTGFVERKLVEDLLRECAKMQQFDHPNVLKLSGICLDGGPAPYVIMPFMANGSLLSYLKQERSKLVLDVDTFDADDAVSGALKFWQPSIFFGTQNLVTSREI